MSTKNKLKFRDVVSGIVFSHLDRLFVKISDTEEGLCNNSAFHRVHKVVKKENKFLIGEVETIPVYPNEWVFVEGSLAE